ncbi:MAG: response regulator transcription factor [Caldilineaceae bacterium]|nr:response regulator transcription factor [Caldilineaceae bacterium]
MGKQLRKLDDTQVSISSYSPVADSLEVNMNIQQKKRGRIRVVLADDHSGVRSGIRFLLEREPGITVVGESTDGVEAMQLVEKLHPDILLLDIEMPGLNGIEVAKRLREQASNVQILALSSYDQREYILEMLELGAAGYLVKDEAPELLVEAVKGISRGETGWYSSRVKRRITNRIQ